ncbi:MAG TPA: glycosyltransferase family 2 protein, partial [Gemmataceae bacterium]
MKDDLVTVIVVNYNGRAYLDACLASLRAQSLPAHRFEVVVVDNGSRDGSAEWLRRAWPGVTVVEAGANLGFAGGNNAGMDRAHGRLFALLNNDAVADPFWLEEMLRAAGVRTAGVAAKLVFLAEPGVIDSAGLRLLRDGRGKDVGFREPDRGQFERPREVFGGCGAGVLLRADALDDGGRLDERLFMYYEDLDLAWRCRLGGGRFAYAPRAVVRHVHCGSSGAGSPFVRFHVERNRALAGARNGDPVLA